MLVLFLQQDTNKQIVHIIIGDVYKFIIYCLISEYLCCFKSVISPIFSEHIFNLYIFSGSFSPEDLTAFMIKSRDKFKCTICAKRFGRKDHLKNHLENIHFPRSFVYTCDLCNNTFNKKRQLWQHNKMRHR